MDPFTAIATYIIFWWLVLFCILPIGLTSQMESGNIVKGSEKGAPVKPNILKKMKWTTFISLGLWLIFFCLVSFKLIKL